MSVVGTTPLAVAPSGDVLAITELTHAYPNGTRALDRVSLSIPRGVFGLLGPNGAGKSTLMRCIATLQVPTQGQISFGDIDALREPSRLRQRLGYLPQDFGVYPRVSAYELLDHLAVLKGIAGRAERKHNVESLLQQVNLWEVRHKAVANFSGGMRQRFGIAQALLGDPRLIIVDEPTAGLDPEERSRFNDLLVEIGERVVVILSTHIVEDVADLCSRMAIIADGQIIGEGAPRDLIRALVGRIFRRTIAKRDLAAHRRDPRFISTRLREGELSIHMLADRAPGPEYEAVTPLLEDVYFSALRRARQPAPESSSDARSKVEPPSAQ